MYEAWRYGLSQDDWKPIVVVKKGFGDINFLNCRPGGIVEYYDPETAPQLLLIPYSLSQALEDFRETEGI